MAIKSVAKEEVVEFLNKIKIFFEPSPDSHAKLPIDITDLDRAIAAAEGGNLEPAEKVVDQAASIFRECDMDDDGDKRHKELYLRCLDLAHAS